VLHAGRARSGDCRPRGLPGFLCLSRTERGKGDILLKIASAYEAASNRRIPPPAFGPLP
jgi:amidase